MIQPYQIFFPVGLAYALWGAAIWVLYALGLTAYPGAEHAHLMISGFLFSFSLGFLMTAVPKFTGSEPAREWELVLGFVLSIGTFVGFASSAAALAVLVFIAGFFLARFRQRRYSPPKHFIFIPMGLALGMLGSVFMMTGVGPGRVFLFQGTMLCLVLGVGGKLVSALLGWGTPPLVQLSVVGQNKSEPLIPARVGIPAALLLAGFLLEFTPLTVLARLLRAAAASFVAIEAWKLHRKPKSPGILVKGLWLSGWSLVAGSWLYAGVPSMGVHALHLIFIAGFGLMTLMIASRVTLAHGGYELDLELRSRALVFAAVMFLSAAGLRMSAPYTPYYFQILVAAACAWIAALLAWIVVFVPKIVRHAP